MIEPIISFAALFVSVCSLAISIYLARFKLRADVTPVLVFTHPKNYEVENFGNGPALEVIVFSTKTGGSDFVRAVSCYPISKDSRNDIPWVRHPGHLGVTYKDIYGNYYTSYCQHDHVEIKRGKEIDYVKLGLELENERVLRFKITNE